MRKSAILAMMALLALVVGIASAGPPGELLQASEFAKYQNFDVVSAAAHVAPAIVVSHDPGAIMNRPAAPALVTSSDRLVISNDCEVVGTLPHRVLGDHSRIDLKGTVSVRKIGLVADPLHNLVLRA